MKNSLNASRRFYSVARTENVAVETNVHKESATFLFRQKRLEAIAARKAEQRKVSGEAKPIRKTPKRSSKGAPIVVPAAVPEMVNRKTGKPLYMISKPISSADAFRAERQRRAAGEEGMVSVTDMTKEEESDSKYGSGEQQEGEGGFNFTRALLMMMAAGVTVEAAIFCVKESKENPPGKLIQLYRYVWERRLKSFSNYWR